MTTNDGYPLDLQNERKTGNEERTTSSSQHHRSPVTSRRILQKLHASLFSISNTHSSNNNSKNNALATTTAVSEVSGRASSFSSIHTSSNNKGPHMNARHQQRVHANLGLQVDDILILFRDLIPSYCLSARRGSSNVVVGRPTNIAHNGCWDEDDDDEVGSRILDDHHDGEEGRALLLERCRYHVANILGGKGPYSSIQPKLWPQKDLEDMANILQTLLDYYGEITTTLSSSSASHSSSASSSSSSQSNMVKNIPPYLLATVHTTMGLLRQAIWGPKCAIENLQKALWIRIKTTPRRGSNVTCFAPQETAMACHRLALAYGAAGRKDEARSLLQAALDNYNLALNTTTSTTVSSSSSSSSAALMMMSPTAASSSGNNMKTILLPFVMVAKEELEKLQRYQQSKEVSVLLASRKREWSSLPTLPIIRIDKGGDLLDEYSTS